MAYGHAERALATIRQLEAETRALLLGLDHLDPEQEQWLADTALADSRRPEPRAVHRADTAA